MDTNETPASKPNLNSPPRQESRSPGTPKKVRITLTVLVCVLLILTLVGIFVSNRVSISTADISLNFSSSIQKLDGGGLAVEFKISRILPAGVGLQNLLESVPNHERIVGVHSEGTATYQVDNRGDWDLTTREGRTILTVPAPELKSVILDRESLKFEMNGEALAAEDAQLAHDILEEKLPDLMRQDEEARRSQRLTAIRERVKKFALESLHNIPAESIDVIFPGDGIANDPSEDVQ